MSHNNTVSIRRLTPLECERLQGFDDHHTAKGVDSNGQVVDIPDTDRYRQCGNAVCVPVAEWIGKQILAFNSDQVSCVESAWS